MIALDRRTIQNFDWFVFGLIVFLSLVGIMSIYSATRPVGTEEGQDFYLKQIVWLGLAIVTLFLFASIDYSWFLRFSTHLYIAGVFTLILVLFIGKTGMGAQRWIHLGPFNFQPSEFFRLVFIIMISSELSKIKAKLHLNHIIKMAAFYVFLPVILIVKEPDLGSAFILVIIFFSILFIRGVHKKALIILLVTGLISAPFMGKIVWSQLKEYQKNRIIAFVKPELDPSGIGYQIDQSKITIGSGRLFGKGYLKGTQGPFRFLPEKHTDFIFSVFAEEWGFFGCAVLLVVYLTIILRGIDTSLKAKDQFGRFLSLSVVVMFFLYLLINIGMTIGMMPVVGIPLPFMSYGGTALITNFAAVGILINIRMRRFSLFY